MRRPQTDRALFFWLGLLEFRGSHAI